MNENEIHQREDGKKEERKEKKKKRWEYERQLVARTRERIKRRWKKASKPFAVCSLKMRKMGEGCTREKVQNNIL